MTPRPSSLREIADRSETLDEFGRHLRDWLHTLRQVSSRPQASKAIRDRPKLLAGSFRGGEVADAWLAAYAEYLSARLDLSPPKWAFASGRIASEPWFADGLDSPVLRGIALRDSPLPFKRRNIYTHSVDLPLRLRAGRPSKTSKEKRRANAERQRRFRRRRKEELAALRRLTAH